MKLTCLFFSSFVSLPLFACAAPTGDATTSDVAEALAGTSTSRYVCNADENGNGPGVVKLAITTDSQAVIKRATLTLPSSKETAAKVEAPGIGVLSFSAFIHLESTGAPVTIGTSVIMSDDDFHLNPNPKALVVTGSFAQRGSSSSAAITCRIVD